MNIALAVVTDSRGLVLIGRRVDGDPTWVFPGGKIEPGETPAEAAVRECMEETGIAVTALHQAGQRLQGDVWRAYIACQPVTEPQRPEPAGGLISAIWVPPRFAAELMPDMGAAARILLGLG